MNETERQIDKHYETLYDKYNEYNDYTPDTNDEIEELESKVAHLKGNIEDIVWLAYNKPIEELQKYIELEGLKY